MSVPLRAFILTPYLIITTYLTNCQCNAVAVVTAGIFRIKRILYCSDARESVSRYWPATLKRNKKKSCPFLLHLSGAELRLTDPQITPCPLVPLFSPKRLLQKTSN